jgi:hypothetical protein
MKFLDKRQQQRDCWKMFMSQMTQEVKVEQDRDQDHEILFFDNQNQILRLQHL